MIRQLHPALVFSLLLALLLLAPTAPASAQAGVGQTEIGAVVADDTATPESIVRATYESIARAPGDPYDWTRFRALFLPEAIMIPNTEQTGGVFRVMSPEDFIAWAESNTAVGGPSDRGFSEYEVSHRVERYGDIAQVFSTYAKRWGDDDAFIGRGINSFLLVNREGRWWISAIAWDEENGAGPIPERYGGER